MERIDVYNPATGHKTGSVGCATSGEVSDTVARAREAQKSWAKQSFGARAKVIARFHDLMIDRAAGVLDTIQSETGKARRDALAELLTVAGTARYYLTHGEQYLTAKRRRGAVPGITSSVIEHRPHGAVGLITPWNFPFLLSIADALPALLAGNAVVVKPSELTPLSAVLGRDLLVSSGLQPDLMGIVHGGGEIGSELIRHTDYIGFTGSTATGRKVAMAAGEGLIPFSLELGGKNPMIVLKGAPLKNAALALLSGAFSNSGQTCISVERVYVEESIFGEFSKLVAAGASGMRLGWSQTWDIDMGSLIHAAHAEKVMGHVEGAIVAGARVLAGGHRRKDLGPCFVEPTVLTHVDHSVPLATQETFGPVVSLYPVRDADEAVARANDSEYGLNASVWAGQSSPAMHVARQIEAGSVAINSTLLVYNTFDVPMGGIKQSGIGRRHGEHGILRYTQAQSIVTSFAARGGYDSVLTKVGSQKLADRFLQAARWWRRIPGIR